MKGPFVLQKGRELSRCWVYYSKDGRHQVWGCADAPFLVPRKAVPLPAGIGLRIRIDKSQRPQRLELHSYLAPNGKGQRRRLDATLGRVQRDGKTVAWNVFFRLPRPERHYYLETWAKWNAVPNARVSILDAAYTFHVRTF
jgi:hypothetical protein